MGLLVLLGQAVAMFVASFVIGYLPLALHSKMSAKKMKAVSVFGMGLLVGAALTVIIPEGVTTLHKGIPRDVLEQETDPTTAIGISLLSGFALMMLVESLTPHPDPDEDDFPSPSGSHLSSSPNDHHDLPQFTNHDEEANDHHDAHHDDVEPSYFTPPYAPHPDPARMNSSTALFPKKTKPPHNDSFKSNRSRASFRRGKDEDRCQEAEGGAHGKGVAGLNATLGLVIHAMADGIALGASSLSASGGLGLVVFLAVIVHKGPTALGLTTTLMSLKLNVPQIRKRLFLFSLSAPIGAIVTYLLVLAFGGGMTATAGSADGLSWWTGIALLFSGGSFLYVATVIQPLSDSGGHDAHSPSHSHDEPEGDLGNFMRLGLLGAGMMLPLIMGLLIGGHDH